VNLAMSYQRLASLRLFSQNSTLTAVLAVGTLLTFTLVVIISIPVGINIVV